MRKIIPAILLFLSCICTAKAQDPNITAIENGFFRNAKKEFKVTEVHLKEDTLVVISLSEFLFYPFGKYADVGNFIKRSHIEWYRSVDRFWYNDTVDMSVYKFWRLDDSYLNFYISIDTELMELINGNITDKEVVLKNQCRVGMSKQNFFNLFFISPTPNMFNGIKYVKFISGLYYLEHVYEFDSDELKRIQFLTEYKYR